MATWRVYHAKYGGDIDGPHFRGHAVFFASTPAIAATYAAHCWYQEVWSDKDGDSESFESALLAAQSVVFPVQLTLNNPAILGRRLLRKISKLLGIPSEKRARFADNFEDSCQEERKSVFDWLHESGYDGAILPRDLMPKYPGGDWHFTRSFVAFHPEQQIQFAISNPAASILH